METEARRREEAEAKLEWERRENQELRRKYQALERELHDRR